MVRAHKTASHRMRRRKFVADGRQHRVDGVPCPVGEVIAAHAVLALEMANHRLDRRTAPEGPLDRCRKPSLPSRHVDPESALLRGMMALVAGIGDDPREIGPDRRLNLRNHAGERVPIVGVAGQRFDMRHELPAPAAPERRRNTHLDADLWTTPALQVGR